MRQMISNQVKRHIPNALSFVRIPLSLSLVWVRPFSATFFALYLACGVTDVADGYLARRWNVESPWGAKLDSLADLVFFSVVFYIILTVLAIPLILVIWAFLLLTFRVIGLLAAFAKFRSWAVLHTYANKLTGFAFYCFPMFSGLVGVAAAGFGLLLVGTFATAEEFYINTHTETLDLDIRGLGDLKAR